MKLTQTLLTAAALSCFAYSASAAVTFNPTGTSAFDGESSITVLLSDLDTGFTANITLTAGGGTFNSNVGDFGIDGVSGANDEIDGTVESITITFSENIEFNFIDLGGVGSEAADGASLTVAGSTISLFSGVSGFNGTTDIYTAPSPITVLTGSDSIVLTGTSATSIFDMEGINITVVPEPGTYALLAGICALGYVMTRRRSAV
jgi:hypothetical protein